LRFQPIHVEEVGDLDHHRGLALQFPDVQPLPQDHIGPHAAGGGQIGVLDPGRDPQLRQRLLRGHFEDEAAAHPHPADGQHPQLSIPPVRHRRYDLNGERTARSTQMMMYQSGSPRVASSGAVCESRPHAVACPIARNNPLMTPSSAGLLPGMILSLTPTNAGTISARNIRTPNSRMAIPAANRKATRIPQTHGSMVALNFLA